MTYEEYKQLMQLDLASLVALGYTPQAQQRQYGSANTGGGPLRLNRGVPQGGRVSARQARAAARTATQIGTITGGVLQRARAAAGIANRPRRR